MRGIPLLLGIACVCGAFVVGCGQSTSDMSDPMAGQNGYTRQNKADLAAMDLTHYKEMYNFGAAGNSNGIQQLMDEGYVVAIDPGTEVEVLKQVADGGEFVKFMSGPHTGQQAYMDMSELTTQSP